MRPADNFLIRHATAVAITVVTLVMVLVAALFYQQNEANAVARDWVTHTYEVKGHIQQLLSGLEDAEVGQRGYMFSGDERFLEPTRMRCEILPTPFRKATRWSGITRLRKKSIF